MSTRLPFFAVSGASGVGKTTATEQLPELVPECVRLDGDLLWRHGYLESAEEIDRYYETWLRLAIEIQRSGRPLVFCGAVHPGRWEALPLRASVARIHYLALICERDVHEARLLGRGSSMDDTYVGPSLEFNEWLRANAASTRPPMDVLDTTRMDAAETAEAVAMWIRGSL